VSLHPAGFLAMGDTLPVKIKLTSNNKAKKDKFRKFHKNILLIYLDLPFFNPAIYPKVRR